MAKKQFKVIVTRTYHKTAEVIVEIDEDTDISDFVANDVKTNNDLEEGLSSASLNGDESDYQYFEVK